MKVKEIAGTSNIAWSPAGQHPIYLATGTAAQQLDATFNTSASLELHALNLNEPGLEMSRRSCLATKDRFYKLAWGCHDLVEDKELTGVIVGGTDNGSLNIYNPSLLLEGEPSALTAQKTLHTGPVKALDFNPFQSNLMVSGGGDSSILIWDLKSLENKPMELGNKSQQPAEEVTGVAWNRQVKYILASSFSSRCVVWDLRKNEPIIKVADGGGSRAARLRTVAWHPEVATQLCLASEDDHYPSVQLWDLRYASSPLKTFERHQGGVLALAWCAEDPDLLLSCGKDSQVLCWNPNATHPSEELVCEMDAAAQWNFDVQWCPRNPSLIATASYERRVSVYSLTGGQQQPSQPQSNARLAESFPGSDMASQIHPSQPTTHPTPVCLLKAPKWMKRPVGATFGFGGKLATFSKQDKSLVELNQVVTEIDFVAKAEHLDACLNTNDLEAFCQEKIGSLTDPGLQLSWGFIRASLDASPRNSRLSLLGFEGRPSSPSQALNHSLIVGDLEQAVGLCMQDGAWPEAFVLAQTGGTELFHRTRQEYLRVSHSPHRKLILAVVTADWAPVIAETTRLTWKETLAALLTHAPPEDLSSLCNSLGRRMEDDLGLAFECMLCYLCTGNLELLARSWTRCFPSPSAESLQELVEQVMVLKKVMRTHPVETGPTLTSLLGQYVQMLCSQGALNIASSYLANSDLPDLESLKDRIYVALGLKAYPGSVCKAPSRQQQQFQSNLSYNAPGANPIPSYQRNGPQAPLKGHMPSAGGIPREQQEQSQQYQQGGGGYQQPGTKPSYPHSSYGSPPPMAGDRSSFLPSQPSSRPASAIGSHYGSPPTHSPLSSYAGSPYQQQKTAATPLSQPNYAPPQASYGSSTSSPLPIPPPKYGSSSVPPPPTQTNFGSAARQGSYGSPPSNSPNFGAPQANYGSGPPAAPASNFAPPPQSNLGGMPPPAQGTGNYGGPPQSTFGHPPPLQPKYATTPQPPPPTNFGISPAPPALSNYGAPAPPHPNLSNPPTASGNFGAPPPPTNYGSAPPHSYNPSQPSFGPPSSLNPPKSNFNAPPPIVQQPNFGMPTPTPPSGMSNYGGMSSNNFSSSPAPRTFHPEPEESQKYPTIYNPSTYSEPAPNPPDSPSPPPTPVQSGWNDPPPVKPRSRAASLAGAPRVPAYPTMPQHNPTPAYPTYNNPMGGQHMQHPEPFSHHSFQPQQQPQQEKPSENRYEPLENHHQQLPHHQLNKDGYAIKPKAPASTQPLMPLPSEHQIIHDTLEELRHRCLENTNNPQQVRKLEELSRRLENLYHRLREQSLTSETLQSLHHIVRTIRESDYHSGLNIHNQLVSSSNFSDISSFMPGIKVLLQTAVSINIQF